MVINILNSVRTIHKSRSLHGENCHVWAFLAVSSIFNIPGQQIENDILIYFLAKTRLFANL